METSHRTAFFDSTGKSLREEADSHKRILSVISASTTSEELYKIAASQFSQLQDINGHSPGELRALMSDPYTCDRTIDQMMQLFQRFQEQGEVWERSSELPLSFPEGTSSRRLGIKLLKEAMQAFNMASSLLDLIPGDALKNSLTQRISQLREKEREDEQAVIASRWDQRLQLKLDETRQALQFCLNICDASVALKVRRANICLRLAQVLPAHEGLTFLTQAAALMDRVEAERPETAELPACKSIRSNIPVLLHLLGRE